MLNDDVLDRGELLVIFVIRSPKVTHRRLEPILRPDQCRIAQPLSDFATAGKLGQVSICLRQEAK